MALDRKRNASPALPRGDALRPLVPGPLRVRHVRPDDERPARLPRAARACAPEGCDDEAARRDGVRGVVVVHDQLGDVRAAAVVDALGVRKSKRLSMLQQGDGIRTVPTRQGHTDVTRMMETPMPNRI